MNHLHRQFVLASIGLGFGFVLLLGAVWNVHALPLDGPTRWPVLLSAWFSSAAGIVLVVYGYHGIRRELYGRR